MRDREWVVCGRRWMDGIFKQRGIWAEKEDEVENRKESA